MDKYDANRGPRRPTRKTRPEDVNQAHLAAYVADTLNIAQAAKMVDDPLAGVGEIGTIEAAAPNPTEPPPSDRQMIYIGDLCRERGLDVPERGSLTVRTASDLISKLKSTPRFPQGVTIEFIEVMGSDHKGGRDGYFALRLDDTLVPVGKYAIENAPTNTENDISFWSVWVNDAGTVWRLKQVVGPNLENVPQGAILPILRRIGDDPEAAMALYGHEIGQCGACGRRLTNELSRRLGIGPICRSMRGWS
jgi:hypothetical protein